MRESALTDLVKEIVAKLEKLGIVPGKDFDASKFNPDFAKRIPQIAFDRIMLQFKVGQSVKNINGWMFDSVTGLYGTDYLNRAFVTAIGLGANRIQDAVYPTSLKSASGDDYSGANKYTIHFPKGQLPPTRGSRKASRSRSSARVAPTCWRQWRRTRHCPLLCVCSPRGRSSAAAPGRRHKQGWSQAIRAA